MNMHISLLFGIPSVRKYAICAGMKRKLQVRSVECFHLDAANNERL